MQKLLKPPFIRYMRSKTWELSSAPCFGLARLSSPGFLRGPSLATIWRDPFWGGYEGESRDSPLFSICFHHFNTSMSYTSFVQRLFHIRSWSRNSLTSTRYTPMYKWLLYVTLRVLSRPVCSMDLSTIITSLWICLQLLLLLWIQMRSPGSSFRELFMTSEALAQTYPEKVWLAPAKSSCHKYFV